MSILIVYWIILFASYAAASRLRGRRAQFAFVPPLTMAVVYAIVFIMGLRMGANRQVIGQLGSIGLQALVLTVACVAGSMAAITGLRKLLGMDRRGQRSGAAEETAPVPTPSASSAEARAELNSTLTILAFVAVGIVLGVLVIQRQSEAFLAAFDRLSGQGTTYLLFVMIALVGFDLGLSGKLAAYLQSVGGLAVAFSLAAILGTLAAGGLAGLLLGFSLREGLAISAGFGWYTYAPAVIAGAGPQYAVAGAVSFLHNVIRETSAIVLIPLFARRVGYLEAVSMPGIAAMDICLPIIERACRQDTVVYAFLMGFLMNLVTSIGVPLIMQL